MKILTLAKSDVVMRHDEYYTS